MADLLNYTAETGKEILTDDSPGFAFKSTATESQALKIDQTVVGSPTVALLGLTVASVASGAAIELLGTSFVSCTTIKFVTGGVAGTGAVRVKYGDNYGWIPVLPDGAVTAAVWEA